MTYSKLCNMLVEAAKAEANAIVNYDLAPNCVFYRNEYEKARNYRQLIEANIQLLRINGY